MLEQAGRPEHRKADQQPVHAVSHVDRVLQADQAQDREGKRQDPQGDHDGAAEVERSQSEARLQENHGTEQASGDKQAQPRLDVMAVVMQAEQQEPSPDQQEHREDLEVSRRPIGFDQRHQQQRHHQRDAADHRGRPGMALAAAVRVIDDAQQLAPSYPRDCSRRTPTVRTTQPIASSRTGAPRQRRVVAKRSMAAFMSAAGSVSPTRHWTLRPCPAASYCPLPSLFVGRKTKRQTGKSLTAH